MRHRHPSRNRLLCALLLLSAPGVTALGGCAGGGRARAQSVPEPLRVPADQRLLLEAHAVGVQIYACEPSHDDPARFDWVLKAPDAQLSDRRGRITIRHSAGPTWEAMDGSRVVGEVIARDSGPDPMAIPWLLLRAKSTGGDGYLSRVQSIQRIDTVGGRAPVGGCTATLAGSDVRIHYTADYLFYVPR